MDRHPDTGSRRRGQRGIALMLVLWVLTLLTLMAVSLAVAQRTELALTDNHIAEARLRALGDAALAQATLQLLAPLPTEADAGLDVWIPDGQPRDWFFAGARVSIRIFNEASRIPLNEAAPEQLSALLQALGVELGEADGLAAAIVDWRDEDDLRLLLGAEDPEYEAEGRPLGAADAPFATLDELQQVLGMTPDIYRRLAPELTLDNPGGGTDETFASPAAIAALHGLSLEDAQEWIAQRDAPELPDGTQALAINRGGPLYRIEVSLPEAGGVSGRRLEALIDVSGGTQQPYRLLWRRFGVTATPPPPAAVD